MKAMLRELNRNWVQIFFIIVVDISKHECIWRQWYFREVQCQNRMVSEML